MLVTSVGRFGQKKENKMPVKITNWMGEDSEEEKKNTDNKYDIDVREYLADVTGGVTEFRRIYLNETINNLNPTQISRLRVEECGDEKTGVRYGNAAKRRGRCRKIGGGGRNKGSRYAYQLWAVWAEKGERNDKKAIK
jgi:hypothetical protein